VKAYKEILESDGLLLVPILGSLADMPLSSEERDDIVAIAQVETSTVYIYSFISSNNAFLLCRIY